MACIAVGLKVIDYGWTAYDTWQAGRTLADPNASQADKMMASLNVSLSLLFEAIEPDDFLPVGLPADDIARRALISGAQEAIDEGGTEALTRFVQEQLGGQADEVLGAMWGALCSFSEDTLVMTEDGLSPISEIDQGDMVLAYDEETGEIGYYPVTAVWEHLDPIVLTLTIDGERLKTTPEHPFYARANEWLPASDLQVGDEIWTSQGTTSTVEAIDLIVGPEPMYNLTVATAHTYFVGSQQWLVHNSCVNFSVDQLQAKFKHAAKFGVTGNWSSANGRLFQKALEAHVRGANTTAIVGTYRGTIDVIHHFDPTTGLNVMTDLNGNFMSGWQLGADQIKNLLEHGNIQ